MLPPRQPGGWSNPDDTDHYEDLPDWASEAGVLVGCRVVQKFNTGWSVGKVLGVEDNRRKHSYGLYFVKHPGDRYPFYDGLAGEYYGKSWFLLKKRAPCEQTSKRNTRRKK